MEHNLNIARDRLEFHLNQALENSFQHWTQLFKLLQEATEDGFMINFGLSRYPQFKICNGSCKQHLLGSQMRKLEGCGHTFCHHCLNTHIRERLRVNPFAYPTCPCCELMSGNINLGRILTNELDAYVTMQEISILQQAWQTRFCNGYQECPYTVQAIHPSSMHQFPCKMNLCIDCYWKRLAVIINEEYTKISASPLSMNGRSLIYSCPEAHQQCIERPDFSEVLRKLPQRLLYTAAYIHRFPLYFTSLRPVYFAVCCACNHISEALSPEIQQCSNCRSCPECGRSAHLGMGCFALAKNLDVPYTTGEMIGPPGPTDHSPDAKAFREVSVKLLELTGKKISSVWMLKNPLRKQYLETVKVAFNAKTMTLFSHWMTGSQARNGIANRVIGLNKSGYSSIPEKMMTRTAASKKKCIRLVVYYTTIRKSRAPPHEPDERDWTLYHSNGTYYCNPSAILFLYTAELN